MFIFFFSCKNILIVFSFFLCRIVTTSSKKLVAEPRLVSQLMGEGGISVSKSDSALSNAEPLSKFGLDGGWVPRGPADTPIRRIDLNKIMRTRLAEKLISPQTLPELI